MKVIDLKKVDPATVVLEAKSILEQGGLVIFPTETTYGAGVLATHQTAVNKLLAYKSRREGKPLSIAVTNLDMAKQYVEVNDQAQKLYAQFLPGPVTVVSKGKKTVAEGVESEYGTLGVRIPDFPLVIELVQALGQPITATSANASGKKSPYSIQDILDGLSAKQKSLIDLVIDAGELPHRPPSTVIDTTLSTPVVFRQGELQTGFSTSAGVELISNSEQETKDIASRLLLKHWENIKASGLVIGLDGSLGMGKTIFSKGVAEFLQISETVTSPTYSYIEEYDYQRFSQHGKFYHLDVWKINSHDEFDRLEIKSLLTAGNVLVIEWYSQVADYLAPVLSSQKTPLITLNFTQQADQRTLTIHD